MKKDHSLDYTIRSLVAGGIAGSIAKTVVAPLDRVKILFQTYHTNYLKYHHSFLGFFKALSDIKQESGVKGLFKGHSVTILRVFPYAGIKFAIYEQVKMKTRNEFVSGSIAGVCSVILTYPFDFLRVRLAFDSTSRLSTVITQVYHQDTRYFRILNFYRGVLPTILGMIPYAGVSFYTYGKLKQYLQGFDLFLNQPPPTPPIVRTPPNVTTTKKTLNPLGTLTSGAISGIIAQTASYPFEVIRRHLQVHNHTSIQETIKDIFKKRGLKGFFVGLSIGYLKVAPLFATSFFTYEYLKRLFHID